MAPADDQGFDGDPNGYDPELDTGGEAAGDDQGGPPQARPAPGQGATAASPDGTPAGAAAPGPGSVEQIPKYRLDEVIGQRDRLAEGYGTLQQRVQVLERMLQAAGGFTAAGGPAMPQMTEQETRLLGQLEGLLEKKYPGILRLLEQREAVMGIAARGPEMARSDEARWNHQAMQTYNQVETTLAEKVLGAGKAAKDLSAEQRAWIRQSFSSWVRVDPTRVARYEDQDPALIGDYFQELETGLIAPVRRSATSPVAQRAARVARLPVGGSSSAPVGTGQPKPNLADEDALHNAAFAALQADLAGEQ